jgi:hypothetical protein
MRAAEPFPLVAPGTERPLRVLETTAPLALAAVL